MNQRTPDGNFVGEAFDQLSHPLRRRILVALARHNPREVSGFMSEYFEGDDDAVAQRRSMLHHQHLPKLANAGLIEWDQDTGTITRGSRFDEIEPLVTLLDDHADKLPGGWP